MAHSKKLLVKNYKLGHFGDPELGCFDPDGLG